MLNEYIFDMRIKELEDTFGERNFGEKRKQIIWEDVKGFSDDWFSSVVNKFLSSSRAAPLPSDFREEARIERSKSGGSQNRIGECPKCDGYGSYTETENGYEYGLQCDCPAGYPLAGGLPRRRK